MKQFSLLALAFRNGLKQIWNEPVTCPWAGHISFLYFSVSNYKMEVGGTANLHRASYMWWVVAGIFLCTRSASPPSHPYVLGIPTLLFHTCGNWWTESQNPSPEGLCLGCDRIRIKPRIFIPNVCHLFYCHILSPGTPHLLGHPRKALLPFLKNFLMLIVFLTEIL